MIPGTVDAPWHFAVQIKDEENQRSLIKELLHTANSMGVLFRRVEVLGPMSVGSTKLIRCKTDLDTLDPLLDRLNAQGRSTIRPSGPSYTADIGSRKGVVATATMQAMPLSGYPVVYRGTKIKFWERQFGG